MGKPYGRILRTYDVDGRLLNGIKSTCANSLAYVRSKEGVHFLELIFV